jgi:hypothetical protein
MFIAISLLFCGVFTAGAAAHRGRNPYAWAAVGVCLGLVGLLIACLQDPLPSSNATSSRTRGLLSKAPAAQAVS